jgi:hypothetical protein
VRGLFCGIDSFSELLSDHRYKTLLIEIIGVYCYTSYFFLAAFINPSNKGAGFIGRDLNSGCACVPTK